MDAHKKLYSLTSGDFLLPLYAAGEIVQQHEAKDIPQLFWPDGSTCLLANFYMLKGYRKGLSRKNNGGTLLTQAKNISHLIRYCYVNQCDFTDLSDSHFRMFINGLLAETHSTKIETLKRDTSHVATIGSACLHFLAFVNDRIPGLNLLGPTGRIRATQKTVEIRTDYGGTIKKKVWQHDALPQPNKSRRRMPISTDAVNRLKDANRNSNVDPFIRARRKLMIRLFELTGGRRIEVWQIKLKDIEKALKTGELEIFTAKQRDQKATRLVPISKTALHGIVSWINHYRRSIIRDTIGLENDHGFLFISKSGKYLEIDTLGSELWELATLAGIDNEEACLHAFRHRYITNIFRHIIRNHKFTAEGDLRKALTSVEELKAKVMEYTGHSTLSSLNRYIHMAFEAESNLQGTLNISQAKTVVDSLLEAIHDYRQEIKNGASPQTTTEILGEMVEVAASELEILIKTNALLQDSQNEELFDFDC